MNLLLKNIEQIQKWGLRSRKVSRSQGSKLKGFYRVR